MFALPGFWFPTYFVFKPIVRQIEINFWNVFNWGSTYFLCDYISPNIIIGEKYVYV